MRVLMITVARMDKGGIESYLMSLARRFDHRKVQVDFVVHRQEKGCYEEEIAGWGSKIYKLPRLSRHPCRYMCELFRIVRGGQYDIIHRHATASVMWIDLAIAKWAGAKVRIAHSHSSSWERKWIHFLCRPLLRHYATDRFACSVLAGKWMYGSSPCLVMHNSISVEAYRFDRAVRRQIRAELQAEKEKIILHVGRLVPVKNHKWMLQLAETMKEDRVKFYFAGDGELRSLLEEEVREKGLQERVVFLGQRSDIGGLMAAADVLLLPSQFEGFPVTLVEAQCSGLPCIASASVTEEVNLGLVEFLSFDLCRWRERILGLFCSDCAREQAYRQVEQAGYSAGKGAQVMLQYYHDRLG